MISKCKGKEVTFPGNSKPQNDRRGMGEGGGILSRSHSQNCSAASRTAAIAEFSPAFMLTVDSSDGALSPLPRSHLVTRMGLCGEGCRWIKEGWWCGEGRRRNREGGGVILHRYSSPNCQSHPAHGDPLHACPHIDAPCWMRCRPRCWPGQAPWAAGCCSWPRSRCQATRRTARP